jgi:threonine/homoserine/homoserine lactone efflux protein
MVDSTGWAAFAGVSAVMIMTPGPDTAVTVRAALIGGRRAGVMTALGVSSGQTVWALATSAGMVALLLASEPLFLTVRYAGAAYLVFLGLQALRAAIARSGPTTGSGSGGTVRGGSAPVGRRPLGPLVAFRQGAVSDLGNPKMAVFFASLLPQFVPPGPGAFGTLFLLGATFATLTFGWLTLYAVVVARAGEVLRRERVRRAIEGVTGVVLVGLGLRLATE